VKSHPCKPSTCEEGQDMRRRLTAPSPALVIALIALFVALGRDELRRDHAAEEQRRHEAVEEERRDGREDQEGRGHGVEDQHQGTDGPQREPRNKRRLGHQRHQRHQPRRSRGEPLREQERCVDDPGERLPLHRNGTELGLHPRHDDRKHLSDQPLRARKPAGRGHDDKSASPTTGGTTTEPPTPLRCCW